MSMTKTLGFFLLRLLAFLLGLVAFYFVGFRASVVLVDIVGTLSPCAGDAQLPTQMMGGLWLTSYQLFVGWLLLAWPLWWWGCGCVVTWDGASLIGRTLGLLTFQVFVAFIGCSVAYAGLLLFVFLRLLSLQRGE
jgi:hypothetical protein